MTYYIGLSKGSLTPSHYNGHRKSTVVVEARKDKDFLSCELWKYLGERQVTKKYLRSVKQKLLAAINKQYQTEFKSIVIE